MPNALMPAAAGPPQPGPPQPGAMLMAAPANRLAPPGAQAAMPPAPAPAPATPAAVAAAHLQSLNVQASQAADVAKKMDYLADMFGRLARKSGVVTREDVLNVGAKAIAERMAKPIDVADFLQKLPPDSKGIKQMLLHRAQTAMHMAVQIKATQAGAANG